MNRNSYCNSGRGVRRITGTGRGRSQRVITGVKLNEVHQLEMA